MSSKVHQTEFWFQHVDDHAMHAAFLEDVRLDRVVLTLREPQTKER